MCAQGKTESGPDTTAELRGQVGEINVNRARYYEVKREIEAILDDPILPRHLQVQFIIDLFDTKGGADIIDLWPEDVPVTREAKASGSDKSSRPKKQTAKKKRAKPTKGRS